MYITARLFHNDVMITDDNIEFKKIYNIKENQHKYIGKTLKVVAGPHKDEHFNNENGIYTVELLESPADFQLPFFNSDLKSVWEYSKIHISI